MIAPPLALKSDVPLIARFWLELVDWVITPLVLITLSEPVPVVVMLPKFALAALMMTLPLPVFIESLLKPPAVVVAEKVPPLVITLPVIVISGFDLTGTVVP